MLINVALSKMYYDIMLGANEMHYVFINENGQLKITQKPACNCHTVHNKNLSEVFEIYDSFFENPLDNDFILEYIEKLDMDVDKFEKQYKLLFEKTFLENPELFI